jgi:hypothetical protein
MYTVPFAYSLRVLSWVSLMLIGRDRGEIWTGEAKKGKVLVIEEEENVVAEKVEGGMYADAMQIS